MNKKDYLDLLRYYLRDLPEIVVEDIVYDYEEHFNIGLSKGKTEEEIAKELGYPDDVAKEYLKGDFNKRPERKAYENSENLAADDLDKEKDSKLGWIILLIVLSPLILSLVASVFAIIVSVFAGLFAAGIGLLGGGLATFASFIPGFSNMVSLSISHPLTRIFTGLALTCLGIVLLYLGVKFVQLMWSLIKKTWITIKWKWVRQ